MVKSMASGQFDANARSMRRFTARFINFTVISSVPSAQHRIGKYNMHLDLSTDQRQRRSGHV